MMTYGDAVTALQGVLVHTVYGTLNTLSFGPEEQTEEGSNLF